MFDFQFIFDIYYLASSPDEKAFLEAAFQLGIKYEGVNKKQETVIDFQVSQLRACKEAMKCSQSRIFDIMNVGRGNDLAS